MKNKIKKRTDFKNLIYLVLFMMALRYFFTPKNLPEDVYDEKIEVLESKEDVRRTESLVKSNSSKNLKSKNTELAGVKNNSKEDNENEEEPAVEFVYEESFVDRVVDGDTIIALIDGKKERVRLSGVNTPESVGDYEDNPQFYGKEASDFTKKSLEGEKIFLEYDEKKKDKYDRILAYVWTEIPNSNFNGFFNIELIEKGYAKWYNDWENKKYSKVFEELEKEAKNQNLGLWK